MRDSISAQLHERTAAKIVDERHSPFPRVRRQGLNTDFVGEALDQVIRRMHFENEAGSRGERLDIVAQMGPVRRADLMQLGPGATHDLRQPEGAANFDELTARDDGFASFRQRI
jgi:hypothetical protein